jgi:hypothetical protein
MIKESLRQPGGEAGIQEFIIIIPGFLPLLLVASEILLDGNNQ